MKKILLSLVVSFCFSLSVSSQDYLTGAGARIGDGLSATIKHFIGESQALELIMGFDRGISIVGVTTFQKQFSAAQPRLYWYFGFGAYIYFSDFNDQTTFIGIAGAIGTEYILPSKKFAFSLDWNPVLSLIGDTGGFNGRYGGVSAKYILQ